MSEQSSITKSPICSRFVCCDLVCYYVMQAFLFISNKNQVHNVASIKLYQYLCLWNQRTKAGFTTKMQYRNTFHALLEITSIILSCTTIVVLLSTFYASPDSYNWFYIGPFPCNVMALYGLSEMLAINMLITASSPEIKKVFGVMILCLFVLAVSFDVVKAVMFAVVPLLISYLLNKIICKSSNRLVYLSVVGVVTLIITGQGMIRLSGEACHTYTDEYSHTITILLIITMLMCLYGAAHTISIASTYASNFLFSNKSKQ